MRTAAIILAVAAAPCMAFSFLSSALSGLRTHGGPCSSVAQQPRLRASVFRLRSQADKDGAVVSPFKDNAPATGGSDGELPFTMDSVDKVLDEVRPYLIADGGNCRVVSIDPVSGSVSLQLEGACGTCPSSTVTMKQGIERVLREKFGERLGEVVSVQPAAAEILNVEVVEKLLAPVKPAIEGLGGVVKVSEVDPVMGTVVLEYKGPEKLVFGIELTLMDSSLVKKVTFV